MKYKIADLIVEFNPIFDVLKNRAKKYEIQNEENCDFKIYVSNEDIKKETDLNLETTKELAEYSIIGATFYRELLNYNGCLLHASAVVVDNEAYLFSAPCGTGKSTHTSLWLKYLSDKNPYILNDDKPALRIIDDEIWAYGTPFSGKHDIHENKKVKLKGICFLEQSKINFIRKVENKEAIKLFLEQTLRKINEDEMLKLLNVLDIIIKKVPIYKLYCDISQEAVQLSYRTMKGENTNED